MRAPAGAAQGGSSAASEVYKGQRYGIRANSIVPGWIETAMTAKAVGNQVFEEKVLKRVPMRRWGQPADFSGLAIYLASAASAYHSGDVLMIDGGFAAF